MLLIKPNQVFGFLPGDANGDNNVDGLDYIIWLNHYNLSSTNGYQDGDFNSDGKVDGVDYIAWLTNYGQRSTSTPTGVSPSLSPRPTNTPTIGGVSPTPPLTSCLLQTGTLVTIRGIQSSIYSKTFNAFTKIDAGTGSDRATWNGSGNWNTPVEISGTDICLHGGAINGGYALTTSWDTTHPTAGFTIKDGSPRMKIEALYIEGIGDGIKNRQGESSGQSGIAYPLTVNGVHMHDIRDDCVESDWQDGLIISDSLLDGCYTTFATQKRSGATTNGSANTWDIQNNLVYMHDQIGVYKGTSPGHSMFFKWDDTSPSIKIYNNIFRVDSNISETSNQFNFRQSKISGCGNNVMIYLGGGNIPWYGGIPPKDPITGQNCFVEMTGQAGLDYWNNASNAWKAQHGI
jgi:hypothetical protein